MFNDKNKVIMQDCFYLRIDRRYVKIKFSDIIYGEAQLNFVKLYVKDKTFLAPCTVKKVCNFLPPQLFGRVHRSYLVGIEHVEEFTSEIAQLSNGKKIPVSKYYMPQFKRKLMILGRKEMSDKRRVVKMVV